MSAVAALRLCKRVRLLCVRPPAYPHVAAFDDLIATLAAAFGALGAKVDVADEPMIGEGLNFLFGAHLLAADVVLPVNCVIVNLEQLRGGMFAQPHYLDLLKRHAVLDYSPRNVLRLRELTGNEHVHVFKVGYVPAATRIPSAARQDVDVLFYGSLNERRNRVLQGLASAGLVVKALPFAYGAERDAWIARSKVVLNVHFYADNIHEIVRTSHLLANSKAVVSECDAETEIDDDVRAALVAVPYEGLVDACVELVRDEAKRRRIEQNGFALFARRDQAQLLAALLPRIFVPLPGSEPGGV